MPSRRSLLGGAISATVVAGVAPEILAQAANANPVKHSICFWCFHARGEKWSADKVCQVARDLGCGSVELIGTEHWATLKKLGLVCAMAPNGMPGAPFMRGFNNPRHRAELVERTRHAIDAAADAGFPNVIAFVGFKWRTPDDAKSGAIPPDEALTECVTGLKAVAGYAEKKGVTLCLEHLNTRDASDPMKGHPGYQGDDLDLCAAILRQVGSPRVKLLFDIYHVQVMHGDLLRRIEQTKDLIGHVHTAGCPGRGELDADQEINFPAVCKKLRAIGYTGYIGHEFIPTRDPLAGLRQALAVCNGG
jgi:hydroxypyruvate isomerase